jgi:hypothetical protein
LREALEPSVAVQEAMKKAVRQMGSLRNSLAHSNPAKYTKASGPVYSLDGGDDE